MSTPVIQSDRYDVIEQVGSGAAGAVFRGHDALLNRAVSIKLVQSVRDPARLAFLYGQWAIQAALSHPNVGEVRDIADHAADGDRVPMLVTPWLEGHTLAELTAGSAMGLDADLVGDLISQAAAGLAHAHEHGLAHGNLKASNVFVCGDGVVKLLDFGPLQPTQDVEVEALQRDDRARLGKLLDGILDVIPASPALPGLRKVARHARDGGLEQASELPAMLSDAIAGAPAEQPETAPGAPSASIDGLLDDAKQMARTRDFTRALDAIGDALRLSPSSAPALALKREVERLSVSAMAGGQLDTGSIAKAVENATAAPAETAGPDLEPRAALQHLDSGVARQEAEPNARNESDQPRKSMLDTALDEPDLGRRIELLSDLNRHHPENRQFAAALELNSRKRDQVKAMAARARRLEQTDSLAAAREQWAILIAIHPDPSVVAELERLDRLIADSTGGGESTPAAPGSTEARNEGAAGRSVSTDSLRLSAEQAGRLERPDPAEEGRSDAAGAKRFASTDTLRLTAEQAEILANRHASQAAASNAPASGASEAETVAGDETVAQAARLQPDSVKHHTAETVQVEYADEPDRVDSAANHELPYVQERGGDVDDPFQEAAQGERDADDELGPEWSEVAEVPMEAVAPPEADPPTDEETAGVPRPGLKVSRKTLFVIGGSALLIVVLFALAFLSGEPAAPVSALEAVTLSASPADAEILVDGKPCGVGDCVAELEPGPHRVTARLPGYALAFELIDVAEADAAGEAPAEPRTVSLELTPLLPSLRIEADLERATVYLDGREAGKVEDGEFSLSMLTTGSHELRIAGAGVESRLRIVVDAARAPRVESLTAREAKALVVAGVGREAVLHSSETERPASVDGTPVGQTASEGLRLSALAEGPHEVVVGDDSGRVAIGFDADDTPQLALVLQTDRNVGSLRITTGEDGATVLLNGKPYRRKTSRGRVTIYLVPRAYDVRVEKEGFKPVAEQSATIRKGEQTRLQFTLEPAPRVARLRIAGGVPEATVFIDNERLGVLDNRGSFTRAGLAPGSHLVEIQAEGFQPVSVRRDFIAGAEVEVRGEMRRALGDLRIELKPAVEGVRLTLRRDGEAGERSVAERLLNLPPGLYTVRAEAPGHEAFSATVSVEPGETKVAVLTLNPVAPKKPAAPVDLLPVLLESGNGWTRAGDAVSRRGGEFALLPGGSRAGVYQFRAKLEKGRRLQWTANYLDVNNYGWFQLGRNRFYRSVVAAGDKSKAVEAEHAAGNFRDVTIRIEVSSDMIVHSLLAGGKWVEIDRWRMTGAGFDKGRVGFRLPGKDQLVLSSLTFQPR